MNLLKKAFSDSIISNEAVNIAKDFSEIALDSILENGLLKEIPIVGTLISIGKLTYNLKDRQTLKKIAIFLSRLDDVTAEEREEFSSKMDDDDKFAESTSEKVLLILERIDETAKALIIGNLFKLFIKKAITQSEFFRFANIIEKAFYDDLLYLASKSNFFIPPTTAGYRKKLSQGTLLGLGIFDQILDDRRVRMAKFADKSQLPLPELDYKLNSYGRILANIMFYEFSFEGFEEYLNDLIEARKNS